MISPPDYYPFTSMTLFLPFRQLEYYIFRLDSVLGTTGDAGKESYMAHDMMSSEEWSATWESRRKGLDLKERVKDVALRGFIVVIRRWIRQCGMTNPSIVELGCAPGVMMRWIQRACPGATLRGVDYSQKGIDQTKVRLTKFGIHADLVHGDVFSLTPLKLSDLAVSFGLIEHFSDPVEVLRMHRKFVRPGGWIAVTVPNFAHPSAVKVLRKYRPHDLETHRLEIMSEAALRCAFEKTGCENIETGRALGPLLPAPSGRRLEDRLYGLFSMLWNTFSFVIPVRWFWPGLYWACGKVSESGQRITEVEQETGGA